MKKLSFRRISYLLHLWLGLISGLIIFIVAITGCIYVFQQELRDMFYPQQSVEAQTGDFLSPVQLREKAQQYLLSKEGEGEIAIYGVSYGNRKKAASVSYDDKNNGYSLLLLNPYTGKYIDTFIYKNDFFGIVLSGHRNLWLPYNIGHQIVGWAVVVFVIVTVSGLVLWIPRKWKKKAVKAGLTIKTKAKRFVLMYDLHKVLGFYSLIPALVIALTGLTWSFKWYADSYYSVISGGEKLKPWEAAVSDTTNIVKGVENPDQVLWDRISKEYAVGEKGTLMFDFPAEKADPYRICFNSADDNYTYYKRHFRFFDRYTTEEISGGGFYGTSYEKSTNAEKFYRMTYDIHVGAIGGLTGKIIVFLTSLIVASLPVTGVYLWIKKRKKRA